MNPQTSSIETLTAVNHGAQLPDMFYHNRRTRPSGLYISVALHRRGFATMAARLLFQASSDNDYLMALAFVSHGVLDRCLHPWINARAGWYDPSLVVSLAYRYQHALAERFIDVYLSRKFSAQWLLGPQFARIWGPQPQYRPVPDPPGLAALRPALQSIYPRCQEDAELELRLRNAWQDSRGYYHWTSNLSDSGYRAGLAEAVMVWHAIRNNPDSVTDDSALRHAAIMHPRILHPDNGHPPAALVALFEDHTPWLDPCHQGEATRLSLNDLWDRARLHMTTLVQQLGRERLALKSEADVLATLLDNGFHDDDLRSWEPGKSECDLGRCLPMDWFAFWFELEGLTQKWPL